MQLKRGQLGGVVAIAAAALCLLACSTSVRRGATLYADGRYIEAAEVFERNEHQLRALSPQEQAEYGIYRGMTLLALGDVASAQRWMAYAYDVERANPGTLSAEGRGQLDRAWTTLQQARPPARLEPPAIATALAASQPSPPIAAPVIAPKADAPGDSPRRRSFVAP